MGTAHMPPRNERRRTKKKAIKKKMTKNSEREDITSMMQCAHAKTKACL
jgi:hypothetical protein